MVANIRSDTVSWWTVVHSHIKDTSKTAKSWEDNYRRKVGLKVDSWREHCLKSTVELFDFAAAYSFVRNWEIIKAIRSTTTEIIPILVKALKEFIKGRDSYNSQTKMIATHKYENIDYRLGFDPKIKVVSELDARFAEIRPMKGRYFDTLVKYEGKRIMESLMKINMKGENSPKRYPSPLASRVEFSAQENAIYVPVAMFMFPVWHDSILPLNMGTVGTAIAEASYRSFKFEGSQYDSFGNQTSWWDPDSHKRYDEELIRTLKEYNGVFYKPNDPRYNAVPHPDNVGYAFGFHFTFSAYSGFLEEHPGLNKRKMTTFEHLSNLQLFSLAWAQSKCEILSEERQIDIFKSEAGVPSSEQVRLGVKTIQFNSFMNAWNCPK